MTDVIKKICNVCGIPFPATDDYFFAREASQDGLRGECKTCHKDSLENKRLLKAVDSTKALDQKLSKVVEAFVDKPAVLDIGSVRAMAEAAMSAFGGPEGLMAMYAAQYIATPAGSAARTKILDSVQKLVREAEKMGAMSEPNELLSDDELNEKTNKFLLTSGAKSA